MFRQVFVRNRLISQSIFYSSCSPRLCLSASTPGTLSHVLGTHKIPSTPSITIIRTKVQAGENRFAGVSKTLHILRMRDKVSPKYELIYRCDLDKYFFFVQVGTLFFMLVVIYHIITNGVAYYNAKMEGKEFKLEKIPKPETPPTQSEKFIRHLREQFGSLEEWENKLPPDTYYLTLQGDPEGLYTFVAMGCVYLLAILRLQHILPVRIYSAPSGHSLAVYMRLLRPRKTVIREFVAGTLKKKSKEILGVAGYRDPSGKTMYFLHNYFRTPSDFHRLLEPPDDPRATRSRNRAKAKSK